ncbi:MAG: alpha-galactosidase [Acutalibacter sp.]|jgi:alpha-galactosidase
MPITYYPEQRLFKLDTSLSTYAFMVYQEGYLIHLYSGAKIPDTDLSYLMHRGTFASFSPANPKVEDPFFSPDIAPMEYPTNGAGDYRIAALSARNSNGDSVTDVRYVSHRIYDGKPDLPGLPATFDREGKAQTLEVETLDAVTGLKATLLYTVFEDYPVLARSVRLENTGSAPLTLERAYSLCLELPTMDLDMVHVYGKWAKENTTVRHPLQHGLQGLQSLRGMTGHGANPMLALPRHTATEEQGEVWGMNLIYSGNFSIEVEVDPQGCPRVLMGINPTDFRWRLEPGETFQTPEAVLVYSDTGLGGMSRTFHHFYLDHLCRSPWTKKERPLLINSWEAAYFDFDDDKLVAFAKEAKELGIDMLVMDDGWFGNRFDDHRALGDWWVNEDKLKGGLSSLIQRVNDLGVQFGIWYEPEMISPDSDLYRAHPDWVICAKGRDKTMARWQCVLDMTRQDVRDNIFQQMYDVISQNNIAYIKWDCNRNITEAASVQLPPERQGEFFHRYVLGVYDLMDRITTAFPNILLENCSGGGGRFDPGMLYYSPQIWASDNTDPIERLTIQFGASLCYPMSTMGAHVSANPRTGIDTRAAVALCGTFGYELDPRKLTQEEREAVKRQTADYHKYYNLTHYGDFYRITSPTDDPYVCDWAFVSPDKTEALFTRVVMRQPINRYQTVCLAGLDPEKLYTDEDTGRVYSGALLMHGGLDLSSYGSGLQDGDSIVKHFIAQ